jgi:hypothetical protein
MLHELDARSSSLNSNETYKSELKEIANKNLEDFIYILGEQAKDNTYNLDWWSSSLASRNQNNSFAFNTFCRLIFIRNKIEKNKGIKKVIVEDSYEYLALIEFASNKNLTIKFDKKKDYLNRLSLKLVLLLYFVKQIIDKSLQYIICRFTGKTVSIKKSQALVLIDTFASPNYYSNDRYYTGILDVLKEQEKERVFFVPTLVSTRIRNLYASYKELRSSSRKFVIKEDYLRFSDLLYACLHCFRISKVKTNKLTLFEINFSSIFLRELRNKEGYRMGIENILNYLFIKRLGELNYEISLFIDWWEGQALDRGYSIGMHKFFPESIVKAYLGLIPSNIDSQLSPTTYEAESLVVPDIFCVMGKGLVGTVKKLNKDQEVAVAPAFRFSHVWKKEIPKNKSEKNILIALPEHVSSSINILNHVSAFEDKHKELNLNFFLKFHPDWPKDVWKHKFKKRWEEFFVETKSFENIIIGKDFLITGNGSTGLEAIACYVPVIIIEDQESLAAPSIPEKIKQGIWKYCLTQENFNNAVTCFLNRDSDSLSRDNILCESIKNDYFEPVSREAVLNFLGTE